jgi:uncharacterized protein DUF4190
MSTPVPPPNPAPGPTPGPAYPPPGQPYGAPGLPGHGAQGHPGYGAPAQPTSTLAVAGLVTSALGCTALVGLVLSIVALVRIRRGTATGRGLAVAGIVVGAVWLVVGLAAGLAAAFGVTGLFVDIFRTCAELGDGVHHVDGVTYTCDV